MTRIQKVEHRARKGAVVVALTRHSYTSLESGLVTYERLQLDRVKSARRSGSIGLVRELEREGKVDGYRLRVMVLDKSVYADDLWAAHAGTTWNTPAEARDAVRDYVVPS